MLLSARLIFQSTAIVFCWTLSAIAQNQDKLTAPALQFTGPAGQTLLVTTRYYDAGQVSRTIANRVNIGESQALQLEPGHEAMRIYIAIPTVQPVQVLLLENGNAIRRLESANSGVLELVFGKIDASENYQPPRALLNAQERELVMQFLTAIESSSTRDLVSELPLANIEWQTLNAYCRVLRSELGRSTRLGSDPTQAHQEAKTLDGWLSWEGRLGARVISGPAEFEGGACRFTLMTIAGKVADLKVEAPAMPDAWFDGFKTVADPRGVDSEFAKYIELAELLTRKLLADEAAAAHNLFSPKFRADILLDSVRQLASKLRELFGSELTRVEYRDWQLGPYDDESHSKRLSIRMAVDFAGGKQAVSAVEFVIPCGQNVVGRGELVSIDVRETLQSFAPHELQTIDTLLSLLFAQETPALATEKYVALLHPEIKMAFATDRLPEFLSRCSEKSGQLAEPPNWWQWKYQTHGSNLAASGTLNCTAGSVDVQVDFAEGKLIGVTLLSSRLALSTLDLVSGIDPAGEVGHRFWEKLLKHDFPAAYALLAPEFQEQLSLEEFERTIAQSDLGHLPELTEVALESLRFSNRIERSIPVACTAIHLAKFADASVLPVQCECRIVKGKFPLLSFTDNFQSTIPVDNIAPIARLLTAFLSNDLEKVVDLMPASERKEIVAPILAAFLQTLTNVLVNANPADPLAQPLQDPRLLHVYADGKRVERIAATIGIGSQEIPFEATLQFGQLKSFYFAAPALQSFVREIDGIECFESLGLDFIQQWMNPTETQPALAYMSAALRSESVLQQLVRQRDELTQEFGKLQLAALVEWAPSSSRNEMRTLFELEFANQLIHVELVFTVSAIDAKISSLKVVP